MLVGDMLVGHALIADALNADALNADVLIADVLIADVLVAKICSRPLRPSLLTHFRISFGVRRRFFPKTFLNKRF
ncbi:hypothetical protein H3V17_00530 [Bartonella sp. M0283]|uniref:hypothetical protein n=1 Tax=Bartonella sp. M0283 TaxID=2751016 RepID=UPI0018DD39FC|nr:hypothetical protein [Bartonella sp. M0283]MBI0162139.1 hypothetical protein [Bartonella sp. M0283]